ncbi:MAG TPA: tetratricopeptide repeat protein [Polyangia bacterium]|nr:tetratricopeptide repeat protein [Polyangia bacterium]
MAVTTTTVRTTVRTCLTRATSAVFAAGVLYLLLVSSAQAQERPLTGQKPLPPDEAHKIEELRKQATETLARGDMEKARAEFEQILKALPYDASAERDAARAAEAAGKFEYAAEALEKAHHFGGHEHDPELHYLRGEALYTLGRDEEAEREHHIAELEIGPNPTDRAQKLWLARIQARKGYVVLADRLYESMLPPAPKFDEEVALNQADAHLMNKDWEGGARVLKRYLTLDPKNVRGREMLAWALEADGDLKGELEVRRSLAEDLPTTVHKKDYGRALERAANFRDASVQYHAALAETASTGEGADTTLVTSYERMRYRSTPEVGGGGQLRSDPQAWSWRAQAGGAVPFGAHHQAGLLAWHDSSQDWHANQVVGANVVREAGTVTGLGGYVMLGHHSGGSLLLGADGRYSSTIGEDADGRAIPGFTSTWGLGGQAELDSPFGDNVQVNIHGDLNEEWNDAPVTIHEGGTMTGVTGHLFLFPKDRIVLFDGGIQERRLMLRPLMAGDPAPTSNQTLAWAGLDFNLWTDGKRVVRGESLDERMVRRTALTDAGVLAYRHYELWADLPPNFYSRISLYSRASIDNGTFIFRKVVAGGRAGFELHGGLGYDNVQNQTLTQGGGALVIASSWSTRLLVTYDIVHQTTIGLPGTLQIGWVTFHADL